MAEAALKSVEKHRIRGLGALEVQQALRAHNPHAPVTELRTMAQIVTAVVEFFSDLPEAERSEIARERGPFRAALQEAAQSLGRVQVEESGRIERTRGSGIGELLSLEEGRARLDRYATAKPIEEWAGPVGGAGDIEARFGIKRTTLNTWYKQGAVVGLLRGQRKLAYPLEQFIDGRPLEGLGEVLRVAPDARSAWLWMRQPHAALEGQTPLALLDKRQADRVHKAARRDFDRETD